MLAFAAVMLTGVSTMSCAQSWPVRPIKLIVPFPPGGATDALARILAEKLPAKLGQSVIIENKPGAATVIGVTAVTKAPADGYTVLVSASSSFAVLPALKANLAYDVEKDLAFVNLSVTAPIVVVTSLQQFNTLADLIAAARTSPKKLRYSSYGAGTSPHLSTELFAAAAKIEVEPIAYKGSGDALLGLLRGDVEFGQETLTAVLPQIKAGKLRALAVMMPERSQFLPQVPGLDELKMPQAAYVPFYGVAVPAGTPGQVIEKLGKAIDEILKAPDAKEKMAAQSLDVVSKGPEEMRAFIRNDLSRFRELGKRPESRLSPQQWNQRIQARPHARIAHTARRSPPANPVRLRPAAGGDIADRRRQGRECALVRHACSHRRPAL